MTMLDQNQTSQSMRDTDTRRFRHIIFIVALLLFVVATILAISARNIAIISAVYSSAALCLLFAFISYFKRFEIFGLKAELKEMKETQRAQSYDIDLVQVISFAGIVSKHEMKHLNGLAAKEGNYDLTYSQDLKDELRRLDAFGFIYPNEGVGLNTIDEDFGADIHKYEARDKTKFNLRDYVHITDYGERYMELAKKLGLPERP